MPRSPDVGGEAKLTELGREIVAEDLAALDRRAASGWGCSWPEFVAEPARWINSVLE